MKDTLKPGITHVHERYVIDAARFTEKIMRKKRKEGQ